MTTATTPTGWRTDRGNRNPVPWEPDTILPSQYLQRRAATETVPERRLLLAVLQDAVDVYVKHGRWQERHARRLYDDVVCWFRSDDDRHLFAFVRICDVLELDPDYLRRGLRIHEPVPTAPSDVKVTRGRAPVRCGRRGAVPSPSAYAPMPAGTPWTGPRVRTLRIARALRQRDVELMYGLSWGTVAMWETCRAPVPRKVWPALDRLATEVVC
jgi:hypothetical protein